MFGNHTKMPVFFLKAQRYLNDTIKMLLSLQYFFPITIVIKILATINFQTLSVGP